MTDAEPASYLLAPRASSDLEEIWLYTAETWSLEQADAYVDDLFRVFDLLVSMPGIGKERDEFEPSVRLYIHRGHLVIYVLREDRVVILRVLGGNQDWQSIVDAIER